jgi:hypothetical protein
MTTDMQKHLAGQRPDEDVPQAFRDSVLVDITNAVDGSPCFGVAVISRAGYELGDPLWVRVWVQPIAVDDRAEPDKVRFLVDVSELESLADDEREAVRDAVGMRNRSFSDYYLQTTAADQAIRSAVVVAQRAQAVL